MKNWFFYMAMPLLGISGCASNPSEQLQVLDSRDSCCSATSEIVVQHELTAPIEVTLDESSPVMMTEMGRSYFYAAKLPTTYTGKTIAIKSRGGSPVVVSMSVGGHLYFLPAITFLDESKKPILMATDNKPIGLCEGFQCSGGLLSRFKIPENAKFALIHANRRRVGEFYYAPMSKTPPSMTVMVGAVPVKVGSNNSAVHVMFSAKGTINISVQ